jgi:predicted CXXCH cytochrome family protein
VNCASCHKQAGESFFAGIHGKRFKEKAMYAPSCAHCHGKHDVLPRTNPDSRTYKMNIPGLCGGCHKEGAPVNRIYNVPQHKIIANYSQGIHGEGLFKRGLIVTATCNDCHGNHKVLPHSDPESTISLKNIAKTCMQCHARIEQTHKKVIRGELWEKAPGAIPACSDCHPPHRVNQQNIVDAIADTRCLKCHERPDIHKMVDGEQMSLRVDVQELLGSAHQKIRCVKCHSDVTLDKSRKRPCETVGQVNCANCHETIAQEYAASGHGEAHAKANPRAPYCTDCHGRSHAVIPRKDDRSPVYRANIPKLCGECHRHEGKAGAESGLGEVDVIADYSKSVHGRGLLEKGLLPTAVCIDCHNSHAVLGKDNPQSAIYHDNIPATCGACHKGIYTDYAKSVHAITRRNEVDAALPTCADCHSAHQISGTHMDAFMAEITKTCGSCHQDLSESYLQTMHGKAYQLGHLKAARCSDCHDPHLTLSVNDPMSMVGARRIVETCRKCHANANERFTGYLTHATHHDRVKYPILFYTFWFMTFLLVGTFAFFGLHTLLWLPRSIQALKQRKQVEAEAPLRHRIYIRRFTRSQRYTHAFVIVSFIGLALTGMMLKFANMGWAQFLSNLVGGVTVAGTIHRICAVITFGYFVFHIGSLIRLKRTWKVSWREMIFGARSLMFNWTDLKEFIGTIRWFVGLGPRPNYGRWTYWEKFDYFAVFWGVAVIGFSGLMLWFPELFTQILPGWLINVAQIIHSDEALLAVGFIFTIHFFNTHLRPDVFPMDTVIFTGMMSLDEYRHTRPRDYEELKKSGRLRRRVTREGPSEKRLRQVRVFGSIALGLGVTLIGLIVYSILFGYQ